MTERHEGIWWAPCIGLAATAGAVLLVGLGSCTDDDSGDDPQPSSTATAGSGGTSTGSGGSGAAGGATGGGGSGGTAGSGGTGGSGGGGGSAGAGGSGGGGGSAGAGGGGGGAGGWPSCAAPPPNVPAKDIPTIWQDHGGSSQPTQVWVDDVIVTAISLGGCAQNERCQLFLQQDPTYASLAIGAQHAVRLLVSPATSVHFTGIGVGDVVDVLAHAWRYDVDGHNELLLEVDTQLPGCIMDVGDETPIPIPDVDLDDLTHQTYEATYGPLLIRVPGVTGTPGASDETFAIRETGVFSDAGIGQVKSLSPYFLVGGQFGSLPQQPTDFVAASGVFGLFVPMPDPNVYKYLMIYPRTMSDIEL